MQTARHVREVNVIAIDEAGARRRADYVMPRIQRSAGLTRSAESHFD
jgi:hypothetical protein